MRWTAPRIRSTLSLLEGIYRQSEIESIVEDAGLRPAQIGWSPKAELTWRSVYEVAASQRAVAALLEAVAEARPGLRERLLELWGVDEEAPAPGSVGEMPPASAIEPAEAAEWLDFSTDGREEAIIEAGRSAFLDIAFLAQGIERARAVCRLAIRFSGEGTATATGFRIGPTEILTAHHAMCRKDLGGRRALAVEAWFNYEDDSRSGPGRIHQVRCAPDSVQGEQAFDWAVIHAVDPIGDQFPALPIGTANRPRRDDRVYVVQHPGGGPKKIALQHNLIRSVTEVAVQYWANTERGSSGAPVFDENWDVVALHHRSGPAPRGDFAGTRNQGVRLDHIARRMATLGVLPAVS